MSKLLKNRVRCLGGWTGEEEILILQDGLVVFQNALGVWQVVYHPEIWEPKEGWDNTTCTNRKQQEIYILCRSKSSGGKERNGEWLSQKEAIQAAYDGLHKRW